MDLTTTYLGLKLKNPIIVGSSTFTGTIEGIINCAKAGAGAVVLKSLFEEQILSDIKKEQSAMELYAMDPDYDVYVKTFMRGNEIGIYEKLIREAKKAVDIPIIASINCTDKGEWTQFAKEMQEAGADAIELNIAISPFDKDVLSQQIENEVIAIFNEVKKSVSIPVAVKIGNHFTNIENMAFRLAEAGAAGLVLFNRFYNTTIDIEKMKVVPGSAISVPEENSEALRWISLLSARKIPCSLSATTGVFSSEDVVRQLLGGATTVQLCSTLYKNGINHIEDIISGVKGWMDKQESRYYYPPIVIHITDGDVSNEVKRDFLIYAERIKSLNTYDGNVLLWNINITRFKQSELLLPAGDKLDALMHSSLALYEASSILPDQFADKIRNLTGEDDELPHRAMGINVTFDSMSKLLDIGTHAI